MPIHEVRVPDLGDFRDVPVVEVLVGPGDAVEAEQALVTLESDKATMEVPAPREGVVGAVNVRVGDPVSEGSLLLTIDSAGRAPETPSVEAPRGEGPAGEARAPLPPPRPILPSRLIPPPVLPPRSRRSLPPSDPSPHRPSAPPESGPAPTPTPPPPCGAMRALSGWISPRSPVAGARDGYSKRT